MVALEQQNHQINFNEFDDFVALEQPHGRLKPKFLQEDHMVIYELPAKFKLRNPSIKKFEN